MNNDYPVRPFAQVGHHDPATLGAPDDPEERIGRASPADIGAHIGQARRDACMTVDVLSERSGIDPFFIIDFEQGRRTPGVGILPRLAESLGVSVEHLKTGKPKDPIPEPAPLACVGPGTSLFDRFHDAIEYCDRHIKNSEGHGGRDALAYITAHRAAKAIIRAFFDPTKPPMKDEVIR